MSHFREWPRAGAEPFNACGTSQEMPWPNTPMWSFRRPGARECPRSWLSWAPPRRRGQPSGPFLRRWRVPLCFSALLCIARRLPSLAAIRHARAIGTPRCVLRLRVPVSRCSVGRALRRRAAGGGVARGVRASNAGGARVVGAYRSSMARLHTSRAAAETRRRGRCPRRRQRMAKRRPVPQEGSWGRRVRLC